jgi:hypothetical protein
MGSASSRQEKSLLPSKAAVKQSLEDVDCYFSIVFVHGLTGNRETTWTYRERVFWPRDLLADDLKNVRIMTFGYDADIVGILKTAGSNTLRGHGKSLAADLAMHRLKTKSVSPPQID